MKVTIYHNPECGTSRNALLAIRRLGHEPHVFEYLTTPMSRGAIAALAATIDVPVRTLVRSKEPLFHELGLDEKDVTEDELIDAMAAHPILINRPIVVVQHEGRITGRLCRPSETVKALLAQASVKA
ncbi:MAG TPA: arsenate reductase (glutaredoxin) [Rhizomicrobium sp.]|jgi:arsenate reductase|nr:arsenate reductase (glutaredoxin) [Rhizomicrobium sp.]